MWLKFETFLNSPLRSVYTKFETNWMMTFQYTHARTDGWSLTISYALSRLRWRGNNHSKVRNLNSRLQSNSHFVASISRTHSYIHQETIRHLVFQCLLFVIKQICLQTSQCNYFHICMDSIISKFVWIYKNDTIPQAVANDSRRKWSNFVWTVEDKWLD